MILLGLRAEIEWLAMKFCFIGKGARKAQITA